MIEQVSTAQMLASKPLFPNKIIGTIQKSQICFLILKSTKLPPTQTTNKHFILCLSHNLNEMVGCQSHLQIENSKPLWPNLWCQYWNCDWNKTKIDARKSRNWCQWAWGNPRDKKDTDTAHCPRPLYLYFVTLWFLVCIQSYVTLSNLYFIILWFLCVRV